MTHYIITNRGVVGSAPNEEIANSGEEDALLRFRCATYDLETKKVRLYQDIDQASYKDVDGGPKPGSVGFLNDLYDSMKSSKKDTLVYVHGAANSQQKVKRTIEHLHKIYVADDGPIGQIVMFSWPSFRSPLQYMDDYADAKASGIAFSRAYRKLSQFFSEFVPQHEPCEQEIHFIAQSMGVKVTQSICRELENSGDDYPCLFATAILAGADVATNALEHGNPLSRITRLAQETNVYMHLKDRVLTVSQTTKHDGKSRLEKYGPESLQAIPRRIKIIDISATRGDEPKDVLGNHWYVLHSDAVIGDVHGVFSGEAHAARGQVDPDGVYRVAEGSSG